MKKHYFLTCLILLILAYNLKAQNSIAILTDPVIATGQVFDEPFYKESLTVDVQDTDGIAMVSFLINDGKDLWVSTDNSSPYEFKYWYTPKDGPNTFKVVVEDLLGNKDTLLIANFYVNYSPSIKYLKGLNQIYVLKAGELKATQYELKAQSFDKEDTDADSLAFYLHTYSPDQDVLLGGVKSNIGSVKTDLPVGTHVIKVKAWDRSLRSTTSWAVTQIIKDSVQSAIIENNAEGWMINRDWSPAEHLDAGSWNSVSNTERNGVKVINLWDAVYAKRMFIGNKLQVIGVKQPGMGSVAIIIDGIASDTIDCNASVENATADAVLFSTIDLSNEVHSLQLSKVAGDWVEINYLIVNEIKLPGSSYATLTDPIISYNQFFNSPFYKETLKVSAEDADGIAKVSFLINDGKDLWVATDTEAPYEFKYWYSPKDGDNTFKVVVEDLLGNKDTVQLASFYINNAPTVKNMKGLDQIMILNSTELVANDFEIKTRGYDKEDVNADSIAFYLHTYNPDLDTELGGLKSNIVSIKTNLALGTHIIKTKVWDKVGRSTLVWSIAQIKADSVQSSIIENNADGWIINRDWNPAEHLDATSWNSVSNVERAGVKVINLWDAIYAKRLFFGNKLQVVGVRQPGMGSLAVIIDGVALDTVNCEDIAENATVDAILFSTESLTNKVHTLQLAKVAGDWVEINYIVVNEVKLPGASYATLTDPVISYNQVFDEPFYNETLKVDARDSDGIAKVTFLINDGKDKWISDDIEAPFEFKYWYSPLDGNNTFKVVVEDLLGNRDTIQLASFYVNNAPTIKYMKGLDQLLILNSGEPVASDYEIKARGYDEEDVNADSLAFYWHTYSPDKDSILGGLKSNLFSVTTDLPLGTNVLKAKAWDEVGRSSMIWAVAQVKADSAQNDTIENNAEGWMINRDWTPSEHLDATSWNSVSNVERTGVKVINLWDAIYAKRMFLGNKLQVIGVKQPGMGSLAISIDGVALDTVNCEDIAENATADAVLFSTTSLSNSAHVLQLSKVAGDWVEINHLIVNEIRTGTTGVKELNKERFSFYPNPVTDIMNFNKNVTATLYNLQGVAVRSVNNSSWMNVEGLSKGVYILRTSNNVVKVVVQ